MPQKCAFCGQRPCAQNPRGGYFDFCGTKCANAYTQAGGPPLHPRSSAPATAVATPAAPAPAPGTAYHPGLCAQCHASACNIEPSGRVHPFCGRRCAQSYLTANPTAQPPAPPSKADAQAAAAALAAGPQPPAQPQPSAQPQPQLPARHTTPVSAPNATLVHATSNRPDASTRSVAAGAPRTT
ncbi:hypothetical protein PAPYR_13513 [Paratrimastix pyriformis]|uniref:Uncharacterized protein n=1 Tax=Paratrimastix pyriformis TaxID=342808 RepID=A0ABQ8U2I1_9EUKA|nr:hypothetical protein PAPYR_13513 [Paratrimastix pyriformis]